MIILLSFFAGVCITLTWAGHAMEAKRTPLFLIMFACCVIGAVVLKGLQ